MFGSRDGYPEHRNRVWRETQRPNCLPFPNGGVIQTVSLGFGWRSWVISGKMDAEGNGLAGRGVPRVKKGEFAMFKQYRVAFTLVELLVVITIIGMLVGLLIPAVQMSKETARRTQCSRNQGELAKALMIYEQEKKSYPGYVNQSLSPTNQPRPLSWLEMLLPYADQEALWKNNGMGWTGTGPSWRLSTADGSISHSAVPNIPLYGCPSDTDRLPYETSYVANCGVQDVLPCPQTGGNPPVNLNPDRLPGDTSNPSPKYNGIFYCRFGLPLPNSNSPSPIRMTLTDVRDGLAQTILISENVQAGPWYTGYPPNSDKAGPWTDTTAKTVGEQIEPLLGFVWWPGPDDNTAAVGINQLKAPRIHPETPDYKLARLSSNHPSVVIVAYCDGHVDQLRADTAPSVLRQLMTPDGASATQGAVQAGFPSTPPY